MNDDAQIKQIGNVWQSPTRDNHTRGRIYHDEGIAPALNTMGGGGREPFILSYSRDKKGKITNYHIKGGVANAIHTSTGSGGNTDQYVVERRKR